MGREARDNRNRNYPKPVERIELSDNKPKLRIALAVILGLFGIVMLVYSFLMFLNGTEEWQDITVPSSAGMNSSSEFVFSYHLGQNGMSAAAEKKALVLLYTDLSVKAYQLFQADELFEGVNNICYINGHPGEKIQVDEVLYHAFETMENEGRRELYLAPVYEQYSSIFFSTTDYEIAEIDPFTNEDARQWFAELTAFAANPEEISLELLGNNTVCLQVGAEYLSYCRGQEITKFIDFNWMTNAFIADYYAKELSANGFTHGCVSSYDGFVRCLDDSEDVYSYPVYSRAGNVISNVGTLTYQGPKTIVTLRNYPMNGLDVSHYYELKNGEIRFPYIDISDGLCKSAIPEITITSGEKECGEILAELIPVFVTDTFEEDGYLELINHNMYPIYTENGMLKCLDHTVKTDK